MEKLIECVKEAIVWKEEITLSSGIKSNFYIDAKKILFEPSSWRQVSVHFCDLLDEYDIDCVGGPSLGAAPIVFGVMNWFYHTKLTGFIVRKDPKNHGIDRLVDGCLGEKVALVEDVCTSGASLIDAAKKIQELGKKVVVAVALVDRGGGINFTKEMQHIPFHSLLTLRDLGL
jgi:orotate phosphoribosyltransferase